ncbi:hypothetical protein MRX96_047758 [Rhipicephalus microplus]
MLLQSLSGFIFPYLVRISAGQPKQHRAREECGSKGSPWYFVIVSVRRFVGLRSVVLSALVSVVLAEKLAGVTSVIGAWMSAGKPLCVVLAGTAAIGAHDALQVRLAVRHCCCSRV